MERDNAPSVVILAAVDQAKEVSIGERRDRRQKKMRGTQEKFVAKQCKKGCLR